MADAPRHLPVRPEWLALHEEAAIEPDLPIVDPHHHLWIKPELTYLLPDYLADRDTGHDVRGTLFVECGQMFRSAGDPALSSLGETEFANGIAAMSASGRFGPCEVAAGLIGYVDLREGRRASGILTAHVAAAGGRLRGIRNISAWHADPAARGSILLPPPGLLDDADFRAGFAALARLGLVFDGFMYHTQLDELDRLAAAFPETTIVVDHAGGPIGIGPYAGRRDAVFRDWRRSMRQLATRPNVRVKLGGFGMQLFGFDFTQRSTPPASEDLAAAWGPYVLACIEDFGAGRCMFESNFPVDKATCSYQVLWNAFKRTAAGVSPAERRDLFAGTACRTYGLTLTAREAEGAERSRMPG